MSKKVLVAYGSKYGATAEIAEKIGKVLSEAGLSVEVKNAKDVKDVTSYDGVVIGSGVYMGMWRKEAVQLLKKQANILAQRKVWCFSSGPTDSGDPIALTQGWSFPKKLKPLAMEIGVGDIVLFHGKSDPAAMNGFDRFVMSKVDAGSGDFRDWEMITTWAASIASELMLADA